MLPPRLFQEHTSTCIQPSHTISKPSGNQSQFGPIDATELAAAGTGVGECGANRPRSTQSPWLYGVTHSLMCVLPPEHSRSGPSMAGPRCVSAEKPRISSTPPIVLEHPRHSAHTWPMVTRARFEEEPLPSCLPVHCGDPRGGLVFAHDDEVSRP